jgi:hypothetical protein
MDADARMVALAAEGNSMEIRQATQLAIRGVGIAFAMNLLSPYLIPWLYDVLGTGGGTLLIQRLYFHIETILNYGGLLIFFMTLRRQQQAKDSA